MGSVNNYVTVTVSRTSIGITQLGFGTLLILSQNAPFSDLSRSYASLPGGAVDYPDTTCPEYLALQAAFGQSPAPKKVKIGRRSLKSTIAYSVAVLTSINGHVYNMYVQGTGIPRQLVTYTADGSATTAEIAAGMVAAFNAVAAKNFTAAGSATPFTVTANAAGSWFVIEAADTNGNPSVTDFSIVMTHADPGIATDLAAITASDPDWYGLCNFSNSPAEGVAAYNWIEANSRTFILDTNESQCITTAIGGATDAMKAAKTAAVTRTAVMYHHRLGQMPAAAWFGRVFPKLPGRIVFADKGLALVDATPLSQTQRDNITARNGNAYETVTQLTGGITFDGKCANGGYLDTIRFLDAFVQDAQASIFGVKLDNDVIAYDNPGIQRIANVFHASIDRWSDIPQGSGFIGSSVVLTVPNRDAVSDADVNTRALNGLSAQATLAGAIGKINVGINVIGQ